MEKKNNMREALKAIVAICDGADTGGLDAIVAIYNIAKSALADATTEKSSAVGNAAAMREALERCADIINKFSLAEIINTPMEVICDIQGIINAALAAPPRNCDVGTPDEQGERCLAQFDQWRREGDGRKLITAIMAWAQMPYNEEGGAK